MKIKDLACVATLLLVVLLSNSMANGQVVDAVKDAASKTKKATVKVSKTTAGAVNETIDATADVGKKAVKTSKKIGDYTIEITENVAGKVYEGGKWFTVTTWDGSKWVSKRVWFATKKSANAAKDVVVGDEDKKP